MYFEGLITIDPSEITKIMRIKPTKVFKRVLYHLTLGGITEKLERETFTAVSILQQLNMSFTKKGINNIIRLSHDSIDFYLDNKGKKDDLKEAFDLYELEAGESMSANFDKLLLVLEHEDEQFKYLLEVMIARDHSVGEYPIAIQVTGLFKEFRETKGQVRIKIEDVFSSQENYDAFKREKLHDFTTFIDDLIMCIKQSIKIDDVRSEIKTKITVPENKIKKKSSIKNYRDNNYHGIHYGYYGFDDYLFYSMLWSSVSQDYPVTHSDTYYESETGSEFGFLENAESHISFFDDSVSIDNRTTIFSSSDTITTIQDIDLDSSSSSGGWFNFDWGDSSGSSSSSCGSSCGGGSSCSSCSSCGGGD